MLWSIIYDENGHALRNSSKCSFAFGHLEHSFNDVILPLVVVIIAIIIIYNIEHKSWIHIYLHNLYLYFSTFQEKYLLHIEMSQG